MARAKVNGFTPCEEQLQRVLKKLQDLEVIHHVMDAMKCAPDRRDVVN